MRTKEIPVCGLAAVQALFDKDPGAVKRLYFDYATSRRVPKIASAMAKTKRIYRVVLPEELEKVGGTVHHGGIVAIIEAKTLPDVTKEQLQRWVAGHAPLLLLDRIGNAHNLGAIARTAAFFGLTDIILPEHPQAAMPSEATYRVAEGGMEHLRFWRASDLARVCGELRASHDVVGAAVGPQAKSLAKWAAQRRGVVKPVALVLGNEERGLSTEVAAACSELVVIPGVGQRVESLNVSVAAAILIWEIWRRGAGRT